VELISNRNRIFGTSLEDKLLLLIHHVAHVHVDIMCRSVCRGPILNMIGIVQVVRSVRSYTLSESLPTACICLTRHSHFCRYKRIFLDEIFSCANIKIARNSTSQTLDFRAYNNVPQSVIFFLTFSLSVSYISESYFKANCIFCVQPTSLQFLCRIDIVSR